MSLTKSILARSESKCELCSNDVQLLAKAVSPKEGSSDDECIVLCEVCQTKMNEDDYDVNHWRCLNESMWSQVPSVQVVSYRMLKGLSSETWAQDALDNMYMDEETTKWAKVGEGVVKVVHKDSNGNILQNGDTVTLIQDLYVKGAGFTAKRGVAVRRIKLVHDNAEHIEGKVDGQHIVILTKYVKKQS